MAHAMLANSKMARFCSMINVLLCFSFSQLQQQGLGTFKFLDGSVYTGDWVDDCMHGQGVYYWANGDMFETHSTFKAVLLSNLSYDGEFRNDMQHGHGVFTIKGFRLVFADSARILLTLICRYSGEWVEDKKTGKGILLKVDGSMEARMYEANSLTAAAPCLIFSLSVSMGRLRKHRSRT